MQTASRQTPLSDPRTVMRVLGSLAVAATPILALWLDIGVGAEAALPIAAGVGFILGLIWRSWLPALAIMALGVVYATGVLVFGDDAGGDAIIGISIAAVLGFLPAAVGAILGAFAGAVAEQWLKR